MKKINGSYSYSQVQKINLKMAIFPNLILNSIKLYENPNWLFCRSLKVHPKIRMQMQETRIGKSIMQ